MPRNCSHVRPSLAGFEDEDDLAAKRGRSRLIVHSSPCSLMVPFHDLIVALNSISFIIAESWLL